VVLISVPYHLDQRLVDFSVGVLADREVTASLPASEDRWQRMAMLYRKVADAVADALREDDSPPLVISGDCTTSLGILAGLQRTGSNVSIVWFDAHADFHTDKTTTSGYLGGMPLALAAGLGRATLPEALGLQPIAGHRIVLVDARDTDPGESELLSHSAVRRVSLQTVHDALPAGDLYLHVDVDVCDASAVADLLYPTPGGPSVNDVVDAVRRVTASGRVAATGIAATWRHTPSGGSANRALLEQLRAAVSH
jgi:arginase